MARGWESKSVEDQISEREAAPSESRETTLTREEKERRAAIGSLRLARTHTLTTMQSSRDERHRVLLQRSLDHLETQIAALENGRTAAPRP